MAEKNMTRAQALTAAIAYAKQDGNVECAAVLSKMLASVTKPRKAVTSKARVLNEKLAKQVVEQFDVETSYSASDVAGFGIAEIASVPKATAVLKVAKELGLISAEKQGKRNVYKLAE